MTKPARALDFSAGASSDAPGRRSHLVVALLLASCAIYEPRIEDCSITCGANGACPERTVCNAGFCRPPGASTSCFCRDGEERRCGEDRGVCVAGLERCVGNVWAGCEGGVAPRTEQCNGLDDDCDGAIDDDVPSLACPLFMGVCEGASLRCVEGTWRGCEPALYGPRYEPFELECDGLDNDCDGLTDRSGSLFLGPAATEWTLLSNGASGFALVQGFDGGVSVTWLDALLERGDVIERNGELLASSVAGDAVVLATRTGLGVELARLTRDGGTSSRLVPEWRAVDRLQLGGTLAAAGLDGSVEVTWLEDAGAPWNLGPAADFELEPTGAALVLPHAILEPRTGAVLRDGGASPLAGVFSLSPTVLVGLPEATGAVPVVHPNLLASDALEAFTAVPLPALGPLAGTVHQGQVVLVGATASEVWVLTPRGAVPIPFEATRFRLAPASGARLALGLEGDGQLRGVFQCSP